MLCLEQWNQSRQVLFYLCYLHKDVRIFIFPLIYPAIDARIDGFSCVGEKLANLCAWIANYIQCTCARWLGMSTQTGAYQPP